MLPASDRFASSPMYDDDDWVGVVDDDPSIRQSLARMFQGNGIRAVTFESAEEYLRRSMPGEPRCIVLDVHLGGLSGFELQARLAESGLLTPIIFITAHDIGSSDLTRCPGPCGYLRKPFDSDALISLVRAHLDDSSTE